MRSRLVTCLTLLLALGRPLAADTLEELESRFRRSASLPEGVLPLLELDRWQPLAGPDECRRRLERWRRLPALHPLVAQTADYLRAQLQRKAGRLDEALRLTAPLGFLGRWQTELSSGERIGLTADPVSGVVSSAEQCELSQGGQHRFESTVGAGAATGAALRVTGSRLQAICCNDECFDQADQRESLFDQAVQQVILQPGSNTISLLFSPELTAVRFAARLTAPDGRALSLRDEGGGSVAVLARAPGGKPAPVVGSLLGSLDTEDPSRALDRCLVANWLGLPPDPLLAEQVLDQCREPDNCELDRALECLEEEPLALQWLKEMRASQPDESAPAAALAGYAAGRQHWRWAWELFQVAGIGKGFPGMGRPERCRALAAGLPVLRNLGLTRVQELLLRQAVGGVGEASPALLAALVELLLEREDDEEATELLARHVARWPGEESLATTLVHLLERAGRLREAAEVVEKLNWLYPTAAYQTVVLASLAERSGELEKASGLYSRLLVRHRYNPYILDRAAEFFYGRKERARALELWQEARRLRPHDAELRKLVERLDPASAASALPDSDELRALAEEATAERGVGFAGVTDRTSVHLHGNGAATLVRLVAVKAMPAAAGRSVVLDFQYDSFLEEATVRRAELLRADGGEQPADETADEGLGDGEYNLYYDMRRVAARFDALDSGDVAVLEYELVIRPSPLGGPFSGVAWLQESYPKHDVRLELAVPPGIELHYHIGTPDPALPIEQSVTESDRGTHLAIEVERLPALTRLPFAVGQHERVLFVHFSTFADWQQYGRWYGRLIASATASDEAMARLAAEMKSRYPDRLARTRALGRLIADEIRYVGLELGVHGLRPYPPPEVLRRGFGDCKDKSLLLVTLLRATGIKASLATVMTAPLGRTRLDPGSPSLFDHAIVYLDEEGLFFDPTARYLGLAALPWQDQGVPAVIVDEQEPRQVETPVAPAEANTVRLRLTVATAEAEGDDGLPSVRGELGFYGQFARQTAAAMENRGSWQKTVEGYVASALPGVELAEVSETIGSEDGEREDCVRIGFSGRWMAAPGREVELLSDLASEWQAVSRPTRAEELFFAHPYRHDFELTFRAGTTGPAEEMESQGEDDALGWTVAAGQTAEGWRVGLLFELRQRRVEAGRYADFRQEALAFQQALSRLVVRRQP